MNELNFLFHIAIVIAFIFLSLKVGKGALISLICLQGVFANLFVVKQTKLFGFSVTCSDVFAIGTILSLNLLQEYYGKEAAKQAVKISFLSLLFFIIIAKVHLFYTPTSLDATQAAFETVFAHSIRIVFASIATFLFVQLWDVHFFGWLKGKLAFRVTLSLICSQLIDTVLFSFLGLFGIVESIFDIIVLSFAIKCIIIFTSSPFVAFSRRFVKREVPI